MASWIHNADGTMWHKLCATTGTNCVPLPAQIVCHYRHKLCATTGTNCVPLLAQIVCHCWHKLCASAGINCVILVAQIVCHHQHKLCATTGTNCVPRPAQIVCHKVAVVFLCFSRELRNAPLECTIWNALSECTPEIAYFGKFIFLYCEIADPEQKWCSGNNHYIHVLHTFNTLTLNELNPYSYRVRERFTRIFLT